MTNGKLRLSKLPKTISDERKAAFKAADKNKDGYLTMEEFQAVPEPKFEFVENKRPAFVDENNAFDCKKIEDALKAADKNTDGVIDEAEIPRVNKVSERERLVKASHLSGMIATLAPLEAN